MMAMGFLLVTAEFLPNGVLVEIAVWSGREERPGRLNFLGSAQCGRL